MQTPDRSALSDIREFQEVLDRAAKKSDISDHLAELFIETLAEKPALIVELGVRDGESTFALERAAGLCGARVLSLDVCDCRRVSKYERWSFVRRDDLEFAPEFEGWCRSLDLAPRIDVLFIDTSHLFEHTVKEIEAYFPFLAERGKVIFHDTNLNYFNYRKSGALCWGSWNNKRGVIRAIEKYFGASFDEKKDFLALKNGWLIRHYACCNGLTILKKNFSPPPKNEA